VQAHRVDEVDIAEVEHDLARATRAGTLERARELMRGAEIYPAAQY
jgi:hypothetical protein